MWALVEDWFIPATDAAQYLLQLEFGTVFMEPGSDLMLFLNEALTKEMCGTFGGGNGAVDSST